MRKEMTMRYERIREDTTRYQHATKINPRRLMFVVLVEEYGRTKV
jgi:hypothetical protein